LFSFSDFEQGTSKLCRADHDYSRIESNSWLGSAEIRLDYRISVFFAKLFLQRE
jgi:hypothetical protein